MIKLDIGTVGETYQRTRGHLLSSMRNKLIAAFLVIILIPMIIVTFYSFSTMKGMASSEVRKELQSNSISLGLMFEAITKEYGIISQNIAFDNSIKMPLKFGLDSQIGVYCEKIKAEKKEIDALAIYKADGTKIYASSDEYEEYSKNVIAENRSITGVIQKNGLNIIAVSPVVDDKDTVIGIVLVSHKIDNALLATISSKIDTNILLYEGKSLIAMAEPDKNIRVPEGESFKALYHSQALEGENYYGSNAVKLFGSNYFINYTAIKDVDNKVAGLLAVAQTDQKLKNSIIKTSMAMSIIFLFSLAFTLRAAVFASSRFTRPIIELMGLMKSVEYGDLTVRSQNRSTDEIGKLSLGFNKMIEELGSIVDTITRRAEEVTGVSDELAVISDTIIHDMDTVVKRIQEVLSGTESNSAALEQTSAGVEEISAKANLIAIEGKKTNGISANAIVISKSGKDAATDARNSVILLMDNLQNTASSIGELERLTQKIYEIIKVIIHVESRTNLLALNASIEAAKAGKIGKGFSVLAEEIKKLSAETKQQINMVKEFTDAINAETKLVVSQMQESLEQAQTETEKVNYVEKVITEIVDSINMVGTGIQKIAEASESQAEATEQMNLAMENVAATTTETAVNSAEVVKTVTDEFELIQRLRGFVDNLNAMSEGFKTTIAKFKVK